MTRIVPAISDTIGRTPLGAGDGAEAVRLLERGSERCRERVDVIEGLRPAGPDVVGQLAGADGRLAAIGEPREQLLG